MWKYDWSRALRRAAAAGVMLSSFSTSLPVFAQNPAHPPDKLPAAKEASPVPPAPTTGTETKPADEAKNGMTEEKPKEEEKKEEEKKEEEKEEEEAADEPPPCDFLQRLFDDECGNNCLDDHGLKLHGWLAQSFTFNPDNPQTNTNGPVSFTDRANEYQLNQLYLIFEKVLDQSADEMQLGGRFDVMYGSDYFFTTARGLELEQNGTQRWNRQKGPNRTNLGPNNGQLHGFAMPQAYVEVAGNDLSVKIGHFYTIIGNEVVTAPQNFFVTHAYTMQYGEPFTHTGVLGNYKLSDKLSASAGIVQGWDNFDDTNHAKSFLGGLTYTNADSGTTVAFAIVTGEEKLNFTDPNDHYRNNRTMYSIVITQNLTEKLTYVIQHDRGAQQGAIPYTDAFGDNYRRKAEWYGINQYLFYQINDDLKAGVRYEWFRDDDGFRVISDQQGANYHELSAGLNWKLCDCLMIRPECRWDWADKIGNQPFDLSNNPAGGPPVGRDGHQFLFATDLIWTY